jgi:pimeloyl-ACP methyl ester carboxylesterase
MTCLREGTISLPDGRRLGYGEYGDRNGVPVLLFHGMPGGRSFDLGRAVAKAGAWLFTLERPGIGLSDSQPGRRLLDWPGDVAAFADAFGLDRFAVVSFSAGAAYALACGRTLAGRIPVIGLVCGWVPFVHDPTLDALLPTDWRRDLERFRAEPDRVIGERFERLTQRCAAWARDPEGFFADMFGPTAGALPAFWMHILAATYGGPPDADDIAIDYSPWGFEVEQVDVPIYAWHGDADDAAPLALVKELTRRAPDASLTVYPGEGHFLSPAHRSEYLSVLTAWQ